MLSKITDMLTYLGCCLIDMSSCFHQNIYHLSVSLLTGSVKWTETILYSERELIRHSWLTTDHSSPSQETWQPSQSGILLIQPSQVYNLHLANSENLIYPTNNRTWHGLQTLSGIKTAAPALSNKRTTSTWPLREANSRAVCPSCKWWGYRDQWSSSQWTESEMRLHIH